MGDLEENTNYDLIVLAGDSRVNSLSPHFCWPNESSKIVSYAWDDAKLETIINRMEANMQTITSDKVLVIILGLHIDFMTLVSTNTKLKCDSKELVQKICSAAEKWKTLYTNCKFIWCLPSVPDFKRHINKSNKPAKYIPYKEQDVNEIDLVRKYFKIVKEMQQNLEPLIPSNSELFDLNLIGLSPRSIANKAKTFAKFEDFDKLPSFVGFQTIDGLHPSPKMAKEFWNHLLKIIPSEDTPNSFEQANQYEDSVKQKLSSTRRSSSRIQIQKFDITPTKDEKDLLMKSDPVASVSESAAIKEEDASTKLSINYNLEKTLETSILNDHSTQNEITLNNEFGNLNSSVPVGNFEVESNVSSPMTEDDFGCHFTDDEDTTTGNLETNINFEGFSGETERNVGKFSKIVLSLKKAIGNDVAVTEDVTFSNVESKSQLPIVELIDSEVDKKFSHEVKSPIKNLEKSMDPLLRSNKCLIEDHEDNRDEKNSKDLKVKSPIKMLKKELTFDSNIVGDDLKSSHKTFGEFLDADGEDDKLKCSVKSFISIKNECLDNKRSLNKDLETDIKIENKKIEKGSCLGSSCLDIESSVKVKKEKGPISLSSDIINQSGSKIVESLKIECDFNNTNLYVAKCSNKEEKNEEKTNLESGCLDEDENTNEGEEINVEEYLASIEKEFLASKSLNVDKPLTNKIDTKNEEVLTNITNIADEKSGIDSQYYSAIAKNVDLQFKNFKQKFGGNASVLDKEVQIVKSDKRVQESVKFDETLQESDKLSKTIQENIILDTVQESVKSDANVLERKKETVLQKRIGLSATKENILQKSESSSTNGDSEEDNGTKTAGKDESNLDKTYEDSDSVDGEAEDTNITEQKENDPDCTFDYSEDFFVIDEVNDKFFMEVCDLEEPCESKITKPINKSSAQYSPERLNKTKQWQDSGSHSKNINIEFSSLKESKSEEGLDMPGLSFVIGLKLDEREKKASYNCVLCTHDKTSSMMSGLEMKNHMYTRKHILNVMFFENSAMYNKYKDDILTPTSTMLSEILKYEAEKISKAQRLTVASKGNFMQKRLEMIHKIKKMQHKISLFPKVQETLKSTSKKSNKKLKYSKEELEPIPAVYKMDLIKIEELQKGRSQGHIVIVTDDRENLDVCLTDFDSRVEVLRVPGLSFKRSVGEIKAHPKYGKGTIFVFICGTHDLLVSVSLPDCLQFNCTNPQTMLNIISCNLAFSKYLVNQALLLNLDILKSTKNDIALFCGIIPVHIRQYNKFSLAYRPCVNIHSSIPSYFLGEDQISNYLCGLKWFNSFAKHHAQTLGYDPWDLEASYYSNDKNNVLLHANGYNLCQKEQLRRINEAKSLCKNLLLQLSTDSTLLVTNNEEKFNPQIHNKVETLLGAPSSTFLQRPANLPSIPPWQMYLPPQISPIFSAPAQIYATLPISAPIESTPNMYMPSQITSSAPFIPASPVFLQPPLPQSASVESTVQLASQLYIPPSVNTDTPVVPVSDVFMIPHPVNAPLVAKNEDLLMPSPFEPILPFNYDQVVIVSDRRYASFIKHLAKQEVFILADQELRIEELEGVLTKKRNYLSKKTTLFLLVNGIHSVTKTVQASVCQASGCRNPIQALNPSDDYDDYQKNIDKHNEKLLAVIRKVKPQLRTGSSIVVLPPLPISLFPTGLSHKKLHDNKFLFPEYIVANRKASIDPLYLYWMEGIFTIAQSSLTKCIEKYPDILDKLDKHGKLQEMKCSGVDQPSYVLWKDVVSDIIDVALENVTSHKSTKSGNILHDKSIESGEEALKKLSTQTLNYKKMEQTGHDLYLRSTLPYDHLVFIGNSASFELLPEINFCSTSQWDFSEIEENKNLLMKMVALNRKVFKNVLFLIISDVSMIGIVERNSECLVKKCVLPMRCIKAMKTKTSLTSRITNVVTEIKKSCIFQTQVVLAPFTPKMYIFISNMNLPIIFHSKMHEYLENQKSTCFVKGNSQKIWEETLKAFELEWLNIASDSKINENVENVKMIVSSLIVNNYIPILWKNLSSESPDKDYPSLSIWKLCIQSLALKAWVSSSISSGEVIGNSDIEASPLFPICPKIKKKGITINIGNNKSKSDKTSIGSSLKFELPDLRATLRSKSTDQAPSHKVESAININRGYDDLINFTKSILNSKKLQKLGDLNSSPSFKKVFIVRHVNQQVSQLELNNPLSACNFKSTMIFHNFANFEESEVKSLLSKLRDFPAKSLCCLVFDISVIADKPVVSASCIENSCKKVLLVNSLNTKSSVESEAANEVYDSISKKLLCIEKFIKNLHKHISVIILPLAPTRIYCEDKVSQNHKKSHIISEMGSCVVQGTNRLWEKAAQTLCFAWNNLMERQNKKHESFGYISSYTASCTRIFPILSNFNDFVDNWIEPDIWRAFVEAFLLPLVPKKAHQKDYETKTMSDKMYVVVKRFSPTIPTMFFEELFQSVDEDVAIRKENDKYILRKMMLPRAILLVKKLNEFRVGDSIPRATIIGITGRDDDPLSLLQDLYISTIFEKVYVKWKPLIIANLIDEVKKVPDVLTLKTKPCRSDKCGGPKKCFKYHGPTDQRRNPLQNNYKIMLCKKILSDKCTALGICGFSHNSYEVQFHPTAYQIKSCKSGLTAELCNKEEICTMAHKNTPEMFFTPDCKDLCVFGAHQSITYFAGAIRASVKQDVKWGNLRVMLISPSSEFLDIAVSVTSDLIHAFKLSVCKLGKSLETPESCAVIVGKPSSFADLEMDILRAMRGAIIIDDVQRIIKNEAQKQDLRKFLKKVKSYSFNVVSNYVFVKDSFRSADIKEISRIFDVPLIDSSDMDVEVQKQYKSKKSHSPTITEAKSSQKSPKRDRKRSRSRSINSKKSRSNSKSHTKIVKSMSISSSSTSSSSSSSSSEDSGSKTHKRRHTGINKLKSKMSNKRSRSRSLSKVDNAKSLRSQPIKRRRRSRSASIEEIESPGRINYQIKNKTLDQFSAMSERSRSKSLESSEGKRIKNMQKFDKIRHSLDDRHSQQTISRSKSPSFIYKEQENYNIDETLPVVDSEISLRERLGSRLYNEYSVALEALRQPFEKEFGVFRNVPELCPYYEHHYDTFTAMYSSQNSGRGDEYKDGLWNQYWKLQFEDIKKQDWQKRQQNLIKEFEKQVVKNSPTYLSSPYLPRKSPYDDGGAFESGRNVVERSNSRSPSPRLNSAYNDQKRLSVFDRMDPGFSSSSNILYSHNDETSSFEFERALELLDRLQDKIGFLGPALQAMAESCRHLGTKTKEAYDVFTVSENMMVINMVCEKSKTLRLSASIENRPLFEQAVDWLPKLLEEAQKGPHLSPVNTFNINELPIDLDAIARVSLGKASEFTLNLIKTALTYEGISDPPKEIVNELFLKVCSIHFSLSMDE